MIKLTPLVCALLLAFPVLGSQEVSPLKKVYISQVVDHPALNATVKGIIDELEQNGFKKGVNLEVRVESAQNSPSLAMQIAAKLISQEPDVTVGVGTVAAQSLAKYAQAGKTTLVFSSVTDPLEAGLVDTLDKPGQNTTGVSNFVELEPQIKLIQKLTPFVKCLGILYNPGESNSLTIVQKLEKICPTMGITLIKQAVHKTSDIAQAATALGNKVDAFFISNDNTALAALPSIIGIANRAKIPVYVSDTDAVKLGALAALGPNQYAIGRQTGILITRILKGEKVEKVPVEFPKNTDLYLNEETAFKLGVIFPKEIRKQAQKIVEKESS